jgi:hypothetical protein
MRFRLTLRVLLSGKVPFLDENHTVLQRELKTTLRYLVMRKMKATLKAIAILTIAITLTAGMQVLKLAEANPYPYGGQIDADPTAKPPNISILPPLNNTAHSRNAINIYLNISFPESEYAAGTGLIRVYYTADWQQNETTLFDTNTRSTLTENYFAHTEELKDIPEGNHNLTIYAVGGGHYPPRGYPHFYTDQYLHEYHTFEINSSSTILFAIYKHPPTIQNVSIKNQTYNLNTIPLNFTVNHSFSRLTYSLDSQANTTINGNTSIAGLANGAHNLTIYANDTAGNVGKSDTVFFSVNTATPTPSLSFRPSLSPPPPTQQSEETPFRGPSEDNQTWVQTIILIYAIPSAVIIAALLITFRKASKKK